jgi:hypothetical protein
MKDRFKRLRSLPDTRGKLHFVAMAGLDECFPQCVSGHRTREGGAEALAQLHSLTPKQLKSLASGKMIRLNNQRHGNDWAVVESCECDEGHIGHLMEIKGSLPDNHGESCDMVAYRVRGVANLDIKIDSVVAKQGE